MLDPFVNLLEQLSKARIIPPTTSILGNQNV